MMSSVLLAMSGISGKLTSMERISEDDILEIAVDAAAIVLENGGETYRAEETAVRTAKSLGAVNPSSFVTPTVVMLSFQNNDGKHYSYLRRIYRRATDLSRLVL